MKKYKLQIATPEGMQYDGEAVQLSVRGSSGELSVLAGHIPFVIALAVGECRVYPEEDKIRRAFCRGGILIVGRDCVRVLSTEFAFTD